MTSIEQARDKVLRREMMLIQAVKEYDAKVQEHIRALRAEADSAPITVEGIAELVEKDRRTIWRWGLSEAKTYAEVWRWVKANRPELLNTLESNRRTR